ncbi:GIN domain-containing protein [Sphingomonas sp. Mn802worker]|uniref:GIN domain-containing protein n=1 Tax=Sphingomonas sp. Mn802worker TaxID=629773 RepID=UPI0003A9E279|nr:DUF2807 domain-containing protein [Sphingomonas sp. Mn802worker]
MRSFSFLALSVLACGLATLPSTRAGAAASGFAVDYALRDFSTIVLGTGAQMQVRVGPTWSVHADGPAAVLATMRVEREGHTLKITRRDPRSKGDAAAERQVRFTVTVPNLTSAALGGSGSINIDRVTGARFNAAVGGRGTLSVGALDTREAEVSIGGAGNVAAGGRVQVLKVSIGGSGSLRAPALHAAQAEVSVAGSGNVVTLVDGPAQVSSVGSGMIDLGPRARCKVTKMGGARVRCGA